MADPTGAEFFGYAAADAPPPPTPGGPHPGAPGQLPTGADFFAPAKPILQGPTQDTIWSSLSDAGARILNATGFGAQDKWGAQPLGLDRDSQAALTRAGVFNDYQNGHTSFLKSVNEAFIRPAAAAVDVAVRGSSSALAGFGAGLEQTAKEVAGPEADDQGHVTGVRSALALPLGVAGELSQAAGEGYLGPEFGADTGHFAEAAAARAERLSDAAKARSVGVIGEGEAGYYGAAPLTQDDLQARTEAANEAGITPVPPELPAPDIHALARRVDPDTFEEYDSLALEREQHRATIEALGRERANSPEALEAQSQIDTILGKVRGVTSRLTNAATERLEAAQARLDAILTTDSPEMTAARTGLMNTDFAMRDLAPQVSDAYRHAAEMMPEKPIETAPGRPGEAAGAPGEEKPGKEPATPDAASQRTPEELAGVRAAEAAGASPEAAAEVAPANVVGERLGAKGVESGPYGSPGPQKSPSLTLPRETERTARPGTGFNGLLDRQGRPLRFKNDQAWQTGKKVSVGFLKNLTVEGVQAATETDDAAYILTSENGATYAFTPHKGISRLVGADAELALAEARGSARGPQGSLTIAPAKGSEVQTREPAGSTTEGEPGGIPAAEIHRAAQDVTEVRRKLPQRENIFQAMKRLGGVKLRKADGSLVPGPDINGDLEALPHQTRRGVVNNASGLSPEQMHEALKEEGWFGHGDVSDEALVDAIRKQAASGDMFHPESDPEGLHARGDELSREMDEAGIQHGDSPTVAAVKLAEYRQVQARIAERMISLREEADALGIPHSIDTTYDELLVDVIERKAIQGDLGFDDLDTYEHDIDAGLTQSELAELDRRAGEGLAAEHGEGEGAFGLSGERDTLAGASEGDRELPEGATGRGDGASGSDHPVDETGEVAIRGSARTTEERAIEAGLDEAFGDQPRYRRMSKADQAARVVELMDRDYETAKEIALGLRDPPAGILPESVFEGVRQRAIASGDWDTARQLATHSKLTAEATEMGRRIGMLARRDPSDPIVAIRDVQRAREEAFGKERDIGAAKAETVSEIKAEVAKAMSKVDQWAQFLRDLECGE